MYLLGGRWRSADRPNRGAGQSACKYFLIYWITCQALLQLCPHCDFYLAATLCLASTTQFLLVYPVVNELIPRTRSRTGDYGLPWKEKNCHPSGLESPRLRSRKLNFLLVPARGPVFPGLRTGASQARQPPDVDPRFAAAQPPGHAAGVLRGFRRYLPGQHRCTRLLPDRRR
jgi:hypothetical protein